MVAAARIVVVTAGCIRTPRMSKRRWGAAAAIDHPASKMRRIIIIGRTRTASAHPPTADTARLSAP